MKKVKIMLSAVLAIAVVGGALAFKVKNDQRYCFYTKVGAGACTTISKIDATDPIATIVEVGGDLNTTRTLTNFNDPCPVLAATACDRSLTLVEGE